MLSECKICGGSIKNDFINGISICQNCENRWDIEDPEYKEYLPAVEKAKKAYILSYSENASSKDVNQAVYLYKTAIMQCSSKTGIIAKGFTEQCENEKNIAETNLIYLKAKDIFNKEDYEKAVLEFKKVEDFKDSQEYISKCQKLQQDQKRKGLPFNIFIGILFSLILFIFVNGKLNLNIYVYILPFIVVSALLSYAGYKNSTLSGVLTLLSFAMFLPTIVFVVLLYVFHLNFISAIVSAFALSVGFTIAILLLSER